MPYPHTWLKAQFLAMRSIPSETLRLEPIAGNRHDRVLVRRESCVLLTEELTPGDALFSAPT